MNFQSLNLSIYLIRHANPLNKLGYWTSFNSPLDEKGKAQAKHLGSQLEKIKFHKIITSPFIRTQQTTEILLNYLKFTKSPQIEAWLGEIDLGDLAGKPKDIVGSNTTLMKILQMEKTTRFEPLVARLLAKSKDYSFPGGENLRDFWYRVEAGFVNLLEGHRDLNHCNIGLIGHGGSFTIIQAVLQNKSFEDPFYTTSAIQMGNFGLIRILEGRVTYIKLN